MTIFVQDLRTFLIASTSLADALGSTTAVFYNHVPQHTPRAYIWIRTSRDEVPRTLDGVGLMHEANIDIEVIGNTETDAQAVADKLHAKLDGYRGTVGSHSAKGLFLSDKDDSYLPRGINSDDGRSVVAYDLRCWYTT